MRPSTFDVVCYLVKQLKLGTPTATLLACGYEWRLILVAEDVARFN